MSKLSDWYLTMIDHLEDDPLYFPVDHESVNLLEEVLIQLAEEDAKCHAPTATKE